MPAAPSRFFLARSAAALARAWAERGDDVVLMVDGLREIHNLAPNEIPGFKSLSVLELFTDLAHCRPSGSITIIVGADNRLPVASRQYFDQIVDLRYALDGSFDHRGTKLCNPPLRVEPMRAPGAIVNASASSDKVHAASLPAASGEARQFQNASRCRRVLQFDIAQSLDSCEQLLCLLTVDGLESLKTVDVKSFVEKFLSTLRRDHVRYLDSLRGNKLIPCGMGEVWREVAVQVAATIIGAP